jgi:hypothetical protein
MAIYTGILTGGANNHETTSEEGNQIGTDFLSEGIVGAYTNTGGVAPATGALAVNAQGTPDTTVAVSAGVAYVTATPTGQNSQLFRVRNSASANVSIAANSSGSTKYDWIYLSVDATNAATPNVAGDNVTTLVASRSTSASTDNGTPPTYGYPIAVVTVANGFSTITNGNIRDLRANASLNTAGSDTASGWTTLGYTPNTVTNNGNRSYTLVYNNVDLTSIISPGMRQKFTRSVNSPTQCTSLNGTTQYYSKTSPAGMTFTNNFVSDVSVRPSSYANGYWESRYDGATGFAVGTTSDGRVVAYGFSGSASNNFSVTSYKSLPLNKFSRVTVQVDMSTTAYGGTNSYIMIDGVEVPGVCARAGTNPTSLIQGGSYQIGAANGANLWPGKIAEAALFNAKVTQATMLGYHSQGYIGTETSLISAHSFDNSINDLNTTNANNLTASGSAVATNADSPFSINSFGTATGTTDYGIVTSSTFSTNTTTVVQVPEGCTIPTSGGVSAVAYSTADTPYGFPKEDDRWEIYSIQKTNAQTTIGALNTDTASNMTITAPIGKYELIFDVFATGQGTTTGSGNNDLAVLVKGASVGNLKGMYLRDTYNTGATAQGVYITGNGAVSISQSAAEVFTVYGNMASFTGGTASFSLRGDVVNGGNVLYLKNAYL